MARKEWGGRREGSGRRAKPIEERAVVKGKIAIRISPESALQLQQLMLRQVPGVRTPEEMVEHLIKQAFTAPASAGQGE